MRKKLLVIIAYAVVIAAAVAAYLVPTGRVYVRPAASAAESPEDGTTAQTADKASKSASDKTAAATTSAAKKKEDKSATAPKQEKSSAAKSITTTPLPVNIKSADGRYEVMRYTDTKDSIAARDSNVRSGPAASYELAGSLKTGEKVTGSGEVKELDGEEISPVWYEIALPDGTRGFVRSDLLSKQQP